ncbi:DNA repair protein RadA [Paludibacteraceae bacterium OttesenSCG-928-F17]|nr:DNA repair protein RadA [Paludibacteraceae bacterium OttesenSCG-928-F17]
MKTQSPIQITAREVETYPFTGDWQKLFGEPDIRFSTLIRGEAKSGKSTYSAKFSQYIGENFGRVLYVSAEERLNSKSLQNRLQHCGVTSERVRFIHTKNIDDIRATIKTGGYRFVIIDSVQHVQMKYTDFEALRTEFKRRKISWHLVMQMGENITKWRHEVDAIIDVKKGIASVHGRYNEASSIKILNHNTNTPTLFD